MSGSTSSRLDLAAEQDRELLQARGLAGGPAGEERVLEVEGLDEAGVERRRVLDPVPERLEQGHGLAHRRDALGIGLEPRDRRLLEQADAQRLLGRRRAPRRRGAPARERRRDRRARARATASSTLAASRTERVTASSTVRPEITSPTSGPSEIRWRVGFSPNRPQQLAGIRIEPPPSLAWAIGTMPEATAAAEPPLEPPVVRSVSQGLRRRPVRARLGRRQDAELGRVGLADRDEARVAEALAEVGVDRAAEARAP